MINAHVGLTYACNMNCEHCYVKEKKHKAVKTNSDILLNRLEYLGTFYITYTMGETLAGADFTTLRARQTKRDSIKFCYLMVQQFSPKKLSGD